MRNYFFILLIIVMPFISISGNSLFDINSQYSSTIFEPGAQSIRIDQNTTYNVGNTNFKSLPVNPGEPEPDPEQTPIGDIPITLMIALSTVYTIKKRNN